MVENRQDRCPYYQSDYFPVYRDHLLVLHSMIFIFLRMCVSVGWVNFGGACVLIFVCLRFGRCEMISDKFSFRVKFFS